MKPSRDRWPAAGPEDALSPHDIRSILDTHGLRIPKDSEASDPARTLRTLYEAWVERQRINPRHKYVIPFRVVFMLLLELYPAMTAWHVLSDAINDPEARIEIVRLRYARKSA